MSDNGRIVNPRRDLAERAPITRAELAKILPPAILAMGQKVYTEIAEEHAAKFEQLSDMLFERVMREMEKRYGLVPVAGACSPDGIDDSSPALRLVDPGTENTDRPVDTAPAVDGPTV